jgi:hypothetical protein
MSAQNSISQLMEQFLELNTNSLETFNRINEAIATDKETVTLDLYDPNTKELNSVQIPAFGFLKREIERLDANLKSITGVDGNSANVRLKDGSFRKIHSSRLKGPSAPITKLAAPTQFNTKLNEFFEDFLNPLLTIKLDVSGQIPVETEKAYIERYIFNADNETTVDTFDERFKNESELTHADFISFITDNEMDYYVDSEVIEMPIRNIQYFGNFDVIQITNEQKSVTVDGTVELKTIKLFTLNKLTYSNSERELQDTEVLKVGDSLVVNSGQYRTRYQIKSIDNSTSQVELQLIEGFEAINVGANQLMVYKDIDTDLDIEINIGFNERQVVFVKPIDANSNIPADVYSPGVGFYSNELELVNSVGDRITLAEYYRDEVADFGEFIKSLSVDYIPPSSAGLKPASPSLNTNNLKVVQVNKHLTNNSTVEKVKKLKSDKTSAIQSLKANDEAISQKKALLNTKKFASLTEKNKQKNELASLISERKSNANLYSSLVTEIKASAESNSLKSVTPKFRVRGFWSIPEPRKVGQQVSQEVVQFKIRYRYLSTNGKTSEIEQIQFEDETNQTSKTAAFSNWVEVNGPVRKRELVDGKYKWVTESEEDGQAVNFNSVDLPIQPGETVEMMVKSISEAGFPANPLESDWSEIIKVEFPEGELSTDSVIELVSENNIDSVKVDIKSDLESEGVYDHVADQFTAGEKFFAHTSATIASGFLTDSQTPISLFDKLIEMQNEINSLKAQIEGTIGELEVSIIDEEGNVTRISNNEKVKLFGGYYVNELPESNFKGYIVTKNFKLQLSNSKASNLELIARIIGDTSTAAPVSTVNSQFGLGSGTIDPKVASNTYYTTEANYDLVPVLYQNLSTQDIAEDWFHPSPQQSSQLKGQFVYSRFNNLANDAELYVTDDIDVNDETGYDTYEYGPSYNISGVQTINGYKDFSSATLATYPTSSNPQDFIWSGNPVGSPTASSNISSSNYDNGLFLHTDHPLVSNAMTVLDIASNGLVGMPKAAVRRADDTYGTAQSAFRKIETTNSAGQPGYRTSGKASFDPADQYLLGGHSCGSFLFLAPLNKESLVVDADNKSGKKVVVANGKNTISIDMIFQYRMTDYHGTGDSGTGRIGGVIGNTFSNLTYSKKIGIDILDSQDNDFKFDVEVYAKYKPTGKNINSITASMLSNYNAGNGIGNGTVDFGTPTIDIS